MNDNTSILGSLLLLGVSAVLVVNSVVSYANGAPEAGLAPLEGQPAPAGVSYEVQPTSIVSDHSTAQCPALSK